MKRSLLILVIACAAMGVEAHEPDDNVFKAFARGWYGHMDQYSRYEREQQLENQRQLDNAAREWEHRRELREIRRQGKRRD